MIPAAKTTVEKRDIYVVTLGEVGPPGPVGPQGPQGIPGISAVPTTSFQNASGVQLRRGCPVAQQPDGTVVRADAINNPRVMGFVVDETIGVGAFGLVQTGGLMDAAEGDWNTATNMTGGLVVGKSYYLSTNPGEITTTPNTNNVVALLGRAVTNLRFYIDIEPPVF